MRVFSLFTALLFLVLFQHSAFCQSTSDRITVLEDYHGYFPCMDCHEDQETNAVPRILEEEHFEPLEWDDDDGITHQVAFGDWVSHLLCGECHGPKLRDWDRGIHGKTTGFWDQNQDEDELSVRKLCVECHAPHSPAFPSMQPLAGPVLRLDPIGHSEESH